MATADRPVLISVDWGTTSFRAYLVAASGAIIARVETGEGILAVQSGAFAAVLGRAVETWRAAHCDLPILLSGMIGSRQGWVEAPYVRCPAGVAEIAQNLVPVPAAGPLDRVWLVPGLDTRDADGRPDVMRGEEVQVLGALAMAPATDASDDAILVLPGTHAKWVTTGGGRITGFATYMTGEVFAALKGHTILGRLMEGEGEHIGGFARGVAAARAGGPPGKLLNLIFSARTLGLFGALEGPEVADYLSGLLIGAEIAAAAGTHRHATIIASAALATRYARAAALLGITATVAPADCAVAGQLAIACAAGIVAP